MELTQYYCQTCGGILKSIGENSLKCTFCGNIYEKDSFQEKARTLRDILDQSKIEHVSNQRRNLYNAICAKYISKAEVQRYATEIKMYLPNDFQANFYLDAISGDAKKINELIRGIDTDECYELLSPIIRFLTASLESEFVLELGNLIERAYLGGSGDAKPLDRPRDDVFQIAVVAAVRKHVLDEVLGRGFALPGQLGGDLAGERHRLGLVLAVVDVQRG